MLNIASPIVKDTIQTVRMEILEACFGTRGLCGRTAGLLSGQGGGRDAEGVWDPLKESLMACPIELVFGLADYLSSSLPIT